MDDTPGNIVEQEATPTITNYYPIAFTNLNRDFQNSADIVKGLQQRFRREIFNLMCDMEDHIALIGIKKN